MGERLIESVRGFAEKLLPDHALFDSLPTLPTPHTRLLQKEGLANWWLPREYGGHGVSLEDSVDIVSELSYADAGFAFGAFLSVLGTTMLQHFCVTELASQCLHRLGGAGGYCAVLVSEQESGSELTRMETTVRRDGEHLVINGDKLFSTNTDLADYLLVAGQSAEDNAVSVVVLVPRDTPGLEVVERWDLIGMRASGTYRVRLSGVRVPAANALRGQGVRILEVGLNASRTLIAATAIGIGRRIRDVCLDYAATKQVKGRPLRENAVFGAKLGQIEMLIDVMKNQCRAAAREFDRLTTGANAPAQLYRAGALRSALSAKMYCGQAGWDIASIGSAMFGGQGYTNDHIIGKLVRDMRYVGLVEGGDDVVRDLLYSRFVLSAARRG